MGHDGTHFSLLVIFQVWLDYQNHPSCFGSWGRGGTAASCLLGISNAKNNHKTNLKSRRAHFICKHNRSDCTHGPATRTRTFFTNSIKRSSASQYFPACQYNEMHGNLRPSVSLFIQCPHRSGRAGFCHRASSAPEAAVMSHIAHFNILRCWGSV